MSRFHDDPRLTAYALGELDAAEATVFAAQIQDDVEALAEVELIRAQGSELGGLFAPAQATLTDLQRVAVTQAAAAEPAVSAPRRTSGWMMRAAIILGIGVSLGLAATWLPSGDEASPELARTNTVTGALPLEGPGVLGSGHHHRNGKKTSFTAAGGARGGGGAGHSVAGETDASKSALTDLQGQHTTDMTAKDGEMARLQQLVSEASRRRQKELAVPTPAFAPGGSTTRHARGVSRVTPNAPAGGPAVQRPVFGDPAEEGALFPSPRNGQKPGWTVDIPNKTPGEQYDASMDNPFLLTAKAHTSTFSIDVDTASYANVRRFLTHQGVLPPAGSVRIEELVNYFTYAYAAPTEGAKHPFATHVQVSSCPWSTKHLLARVAIKGKEVKAEERPAANLVFLVDVSGSMQPANKLPLVKQGLRLLVGKLDRRDKVAIVTYAGTAGLALPSTSCAEKDAILAAIDNLNAAGSTNGEAGIEVAYRIAKENFIKGGLNRVMLATDGDFNVGQTSRDALLSLIKDRAAAGTYLSVLGFGMGNYKDGRLESISNHGNGTYAYIDSLAEVKKVLVEGITGQLVPIAKDVKIQMFFNPKTVSAYRLIGYENRILAAKDFNDDTKDAGDVGAGHTVTAFYEIVPVGQPLPGRAVDPNPFVNAAKPAAKPAEDAVEHKTALFQLRLRYKQPDGDTSTLIERMIEPSDQGFDQTDGDYRFAAAVAAFGMKLRRSPHQGRIGWDAILEVAESSVGDDPHGRRSEFLALVRKAKELFGQ